MFIASARAENRLSTLIFIPGNLVKPMRARTRSFAAFLVLVDTAGASEVLPGTTARILTSPFPR